MQTFLNYTERSSDFVRPVNFRVNKNGYKFSINWHGWGGGLHYLHAELYLYQFSQDNYAFNKNSWTPLKYNRKFLKHSSTEIFFHFDTWPQYRFLTSAIIFKFLKECCKNDKKL